MLHIHLSNRLEALRDALLQRLDAAAPADVFTAEQVIVPSAALRRHLTLAIADARGICANVQFGFLAQWLWQQMARVVPGVGAESPFAAATLAWRVHAAFGDAGFVAGHPRLQAYLGRADAVMRYELAVPGGGAARAVRHLPPRLAAGLARRPDRAAARRGHGLAGRAEW